MPERRGRTPMSTTSQQIPRRLPLLFALMLLAVSGASAQTFQQRFAEALGVFASGDYAEAVRAFDALEADFGEEPEYQADAARRSLLIAKGEALLRTGEPGRAVEALEAWLAAFGEAERGRIRHRQALFSLAQASEQAGDSTAAAAAYERVALEYPDSTLAKMARLKRAELLARTGSVDEAIAELERMRAGEEAVGWRQQARLLAAQLAMEHGNADLAARLLLDGPWSVVEMPELAVLSFAALKAGDQMLASRRAEDALRCYRLVMPRGGLLQAQRGRIANLREKLASAGDAAGPLHAYTATLLADCEAQLVRLESEEDFTPGFLLRYGQAFLMVGRPREAALVFEQLTGDGAVPLDLRREALYRLVLAAREMGDIARARALAERFFEEHPDGPLAADTLFLLANILQERGELSEADALLTKLLADYAAFPHAPRWRYRRGLCRLLRGHFAEARADFGKAAAVAASGLAAKARLWAAVALSYQGRHAEALEELDALIEEGALAEVEPEALYRRASLLYAIRRLDEALQATGDFRERFLEHGRADDVSALRGDTLIALDEPDRARAMYAEVPPDDPRLFAYAVFKTGGIFRAQRDYENVVLHFQSYLDASAPQDKLRKAEALYWIGWARIQQGRAEEALPVYTAALEIYGDAPLEPEVALLLDALRELRASASLEGAADFPGFGEWLKGERQAALEAGRSVYYARLSLYLADLHAAGGNATRAETLLLEVVNAVPAEELGPRVLGETGRKLLALGLPSGRGRLEALLGRFPQSPHSALARHGLAELLMREQKPGEALAHLNLLRKDTPDHPLFVPASLLRVRCLAGLGEDAGALAACEELLRRKDLRGRPQAEVLMELARYWRGRGEPGKAIAYFQRVYTLHRAERDLVARAYLESAALFGLLGDAEAALTTLRELAEQADLANHYDQRQLATEIARLETEAPLEVEAPDTEAP